MPYIVDVDNSIGQPRPRLRISIDQDRLEFFGVEQQDVYDTIKALFGGTTIGYSHRGEGRNPIEIVVGLPKRNLSWSELLASTPVPANVRAGLEERGASSATWCTSRRNSARPPSFAATAASPTW